MMDLGPVLPERFAQLVSGADQQILETIRADGVGDVLDRIVEGLRRRFDPERAHGVDATIQFIILDEDEWHAYVVTIREGACWVRRAQAGAPTVTLTTDPVSFVRLVAGQVSGRSLLTTGNVRISGDGRFAQRITSFFQPIRAA